MAAQAACNNRYEQMGCSPIILERPRYEFVPFEQDSQDLGKSPLPGTQAMQAIQDLPPTPAPSEPPARPPSPATAQQLQLTLTDMGAASNLTRAERHLRPTKSPPPPPPLPGEGHLPSFC